MIYPLNSLEKTQRKADFSKLCAAIIGLSGKSVGRPLRDCKVNSVRGLNEAKDESIRLHRAASTMVVNLGQEEDGRA